MENKMKTSKLFESAVKETEEYKQGFLAGKQQATKEIFEKIKEMGFEIKNEIGKDYYLIIPSDNWKILKVQLSKVGEEQ